MVFPSVPIYLDPPNWQQQQQNHQPGSSSENHQHPQSSSLSPAAAVSGSSSGSIRPNSMADRARLAKIPQPEASLKCPRCESTNTKFCYFNNYSLSQPRHFCKTCRRYWTRGGALRNVPVGGGCRRNKRSKSSSSKSPQVPSASSSAIPSNTCTVDLIGHMPQPPQQVPFMPSLHHLFDYGGGDIGLNFAGIQAASDMDFQMNTILPEQWRLQQVQQFPFLAGLEPPAPGLYPFDSEVVEPGYEGSGASQIRTKPSSSIVNQMASVKMEDSPQGLNLSRQFLGIPGHDQYWSGSAWTDLSNFTPSSTSHLM